jgi:hypothetical protein
VPLNSTSFVYFHEHFVYIQLRLATHFLPISKRQFLQLQEKVATVMLLAHLSIFLSARLAVTVASMIPGRIYKLR